MKWCKRWGPVIVWLAVTFVVVSVAAQAIRQGSWGPVSEFGWLPAVMVAVSSRSNRRCLPRRNRRAE